MCQCSPDTSGRCSGANRAAMNSAGSTNLSAHAIPTTETHIGKIAATK
jgi:hypothetical protein